jgi:cob(I)alamin adenosyltransferase
MLYTRKGDQGTSGLFGTRDRFPKDSAVYEALGTVDELNSLLGLCRAKAAKKRDEIDLRLETRRVQECLFIVQAELAGAPKTILPQHVSALEYAIDHIESTIENPHSFVIPGETELSALFDYARTIARRAERAVIRAGPERAVSPESRAYLNRLSSFLYAAARHAAMRAGAKELSPSYA